MRISTNTIVPITEASKHFKAVCDKTEENGALFIFKNNLPKIVLMNMKHYEKLMSVIDAIEHEEIYQMLKSRGLLDSGKPVGKLYSVDELDD